MIYRDVHAPEKKNKTAPSHMNYYFTVFCFPFSMLKTSDHIHYKFSISQRKEKDYKLWVLFFFIALKL